MKVQPPRKNIIEGYKHCPKCDCYKPVAQFFLHSARGDGRQPYCKTCRAAHRNLRTEWLSDKYGISPQDYTTLLHEQEGKCAICGCLPTRIREDGIEVFHIDHDHVTGVVRGLLCAACNQRVGRIENMPSDLLERTLEYLDAGTFTAWGEAIENRPPDQDVVQRFLTDCCLTQNTSEIRASVLYRAFVQWCAEEGETVRSQTRFGSVLAQKGYQKRRSAGIRWMGLALKATDGTSSQIDA